MANKLINKTCMVPFNGNPAYSGYKYDTTGSQTGKTGRTSSWIWSYDYDQDLLIIKDDNQFNQPITPSRVTQNTYVFGETLNRSTTLPYRYKYTAREWDSETQTNYFRARNQDPRTGRILSIDPIGYLAGINLYTYVQSNPI